MAEQGLNLEKERWRNDPESGEMILNLMRNDPESNERNDPESNGAGEMILNPMIQVMSLNLEKERRRWCSRSTPRASIASPGTLS